jgi:hypothetical protein
VSAASLGAVSSIGYLISFISFSIIGLALFKFATRHRELTRGVVSEMSSDFLDTKIPVFIASVLTLGIFLAIVVAIHDWEVSRYS